MRVLAALLLPLAVFHADAVVRQSDEWRVVAKLMSVAPGQAGCGVMLVGTTATYLVVEGPAALNGKRINVVVPCIEMPRATFGAKAGDLEAFVVGQTHHLIIGKQADRRLDTPEKLPDGPRWFHLKAASLKPLPLQAS